MNLTSIKLTVTGAHAWAKVNGRLTSGMVGLPVTIEYDEAWEGLIKNLVCRCTPWDSDEGETRVVLNVGNTATVAHEVMQAGMRLHLGVEGFREDGTLVIPTNWAICEELIQPGANSDGDPTADPSLPVWDQIQAQIEQINRDGITQERMDEIRDCAESAARAAADAARSEVSAAAAASLAVTSTNAAEAAAIQAKASEEHAKTSASSAANLANGALQAQKAAQAAAERAELAADCLLAPVSKTADMTQPVGVDEDGRLWTAPTAGETADVLIGVLPQTIPGAGYYLLSDTDAAVTTDPGDGNAGPTNLLDGVGILNDKVSYADGVVTITAGTVWERFADLTPLLEPGQLYTWAFESVNVQTGNGFRVYAGDSPDTSGTLIANCSVYWANETGSGWADSIHAQNGVNQAAMTWDGTSRYVSLMIGGLAGTSHKLALYKGAVTDGSEPIITLTLAAGEKKAMDSYIGKMFYSDSTVRLYKTAEQTEEEALAVDQRPLAGKHGLFIGDSLTTTLTGQDPETNGYIHAEKSYPDYFSEKTGCIAHNHGASGASAKSFLEVKYPEIDFSIEYDFAIIMLGTNASLGDVYGEAYASLIEQLAEDTGGKTQIFLVTPPYNGYNGSNAQWAKDAVQPVKDFGAEYHLPVIDVYNDSGINQFNGALYRPIDDLHFNDAGYERLAGFIASQVLSKYWL